MSGCNSLEASISFASVNNARLFFSSAYRNLTPPRLFRDSSLAGRNSLIRQSFSYYFYLFDFKILPNHVSPLPVTNV